MQSSSTAPFTLTKLQVAVRAIRTFRSWPLFLHARLFPGRDRTFTLRNGVRLRGGSDPTHVSIISEVFLYQAYVRHLSAEPRVIVDIGANVGYFTVFAASRFPRARIFAFEPYRPNFDRLLEHLEMNGLGNVTPVNAAVSAVRGSHPLAVAANTGEHSLLWEGKQRETVDVETIPLAEVFTIYSIEECDLLKLDCEGSEYDILYSFPNTERIHALAIETHEIDRDQRNHAHLGQFLCQQGYTVVAEEVGSCPFLYGWFPAPVREREGSE